MVNFPKRQTIHYDDKQQTYKQSLANDISMEIEELEETKQCQIFENQSATAREICQAFANDITSLVLTIAPTQAGKTGTMLSVLKEYYTTDDYAAPHPDNVWLISGLSDCEWKRQTRDRMPATIHEKVIHRPDLKKDFLEKASIMTDALIIIDEAQVANKVGQTIYTIFNKAGLLDLSQLAERNIRILMFTATPSALNIETDLLGEYHKVVLMHPPVSYISSMDLLKKGQLQEVKNISGVNNNGEIVIPPEQIKQNTQELKQAIMSFTTPRYHLVRIHKGIIGQAAAENVIDEFSDPRDDVLFRCYYQNSKSAEKRTTKRYNDAIKMINTDINNLLKKRPQKHTIIFIKDRLRCAKTLVKKHIGVEYERHSNSGNDEVNIQGIRATGYDSGDIVVFANINSVKRYQNLFDTQFKSKNLPWMSSTTTWSKCLETLQTTPTFISAIKFGKVGNLIPSEGKMEDI
jgi:hypothetical protein